MVKIVEIFKVTLNGESLINAQMFTEFIESFNNLKDENTKLRIILLVKDLARLQKN